MPASEYLPVATAVGANVDSQANFAGSGYQEVGFQSGLAKSNQANKVWRQASMVAAAITNFIVNVLGINVPDDGNLTNLVSQFTAAVTQAGTGIQTQAFSATPAFNIALGTKIDMTLTGSVTSSTISGQNPGELITFIIHQDATGGRTFAWPSTVPGGTIDSGASKTSLQSFMVDAAGNIRPFGGMTSS